MSGLNLKEMFCEILSGITLVFCILPILDLLGLVCLSHVFTFIGQRVTGTLVFVSICVFYLFGFLVDAVGFAMDYLILEKIYNIGSLKPDERTKFWKNVKEHVLKYRDTQWTFYSCYRNLFVLFIPGGFFWIWLICKVSQWYYGLILAIVVLFMEFFLFKTMKALVKLYNEITRSV
jgi:hypothetical protein